MEWTAKAAAEFCFTRGDPLKSVKVGRQHGIFSSSVAPRMFLISIAGGAPATYAEQCDFLKLVQSLNVLHQEGGGPFEALDLDPRTRHLDLYYAQATLLDKNWQPQSLGTSVAEDALDVAAILFARRASP